MVVSARRADRLEEVVAAITAAGGRALAVPADVTREDDMTRLGVRKSQLELALGDPGAQSSFVELRRLTSELADVDQALAQAEEAWLALEERAPR